MKRERLVFPYTTTDPINKVGVYDESPKKGHPQAISKTDSDC